MGRRMRRLQYRTRLPLVVVGVHEPKLTVQEVNRIKRTIHNEVGQCRLIVHTENIDITVEG